MLILTRKMGEKVFIGKDICVTVGNISAGTVTIGFDAPKNVNIVREEVLMRNANRMIQENLMDEEEEVDYNY